MTQEGHSNLASILKAASRGDGAAWREVVRLYGRRVFALARSRCRNVDVAEEITQSVFVTIATKLGGGEYSEQGKFESWLFRVAMNRVRDHVRKEVRRPGHVEVQEDDGARAEPERVEGVDLKRLRAAMGQLPEADREIVELRHHGGMSFKDMAELLEEPMGTLLARHHRALKKLKELMEGMAADRAGTTDRGVRA